MCIQKCTELDTDNSNHCTATQSEINEKEQNGNDYCPCGNVVRWKLIQKMMRSLVTGYNLTENKDYGVVFEYDTVYEVVCNEGKILCRPKGFFSEITDGGEGK